MEGFYKTYFDIFETIEESLLKGKIVPCLILIYSAIDSFSFLAEKTNRKGRGVFKEWVKKWMLEKYPLPCNENDIYSARCGLLHQQISESDLSNEGESLEIYYTWGKSNVELLKYSIANSNKKDSVIAVRVEELLESFRKGLVDCKIEIEKDERWGTLFEEKAKKLFTSIMHKE